MTEPRLKTGLWISAQIRLCDMAFMPAVVARRGDSDAGQVMILRDLLDGTFELFARTRDPDGNPAWRRVSGPDPVDYAAANDLIASEAGFDPDIWVLEIEDRDRKYELDAPVI
tara:strand:- start:12399 stop:12737 length:339 start_codon:yes stop_codon:yes gene_type:complete